MAQYTQELQVAKKAARKAAEIIQSYQKKSNFRIAHKGHNDLVTDADVAAEEQIIDILREHYPGDQILAEETSKEKVIPHERTWLIDPIDGTTNFAHGFPIFCVSIGLWENNEPKAGVVLEVNSLEIFEALDGGGAYCDEEPLRVSTVESEAHALIGTGFPYNDFRLTEHYLRLFDMLMQQTHGVRRPGAASYDLCCVAAGRLDGFYEYALSPWDVGAAGLIVKEAGGVITDWEGGDDWLFGERVIAGNPHIHSFLQQSIARHFTEEERRAER